MATYRGQINLQIPELSKKLRETVNKTCRFRQFATLREAFGLGRGNIVEWVLTGDDPTINIFSRSVANATAALATNEGITLIPNKKEIMEFGYSVQYNKYDIEQSEINYVDIIRKYLAREVACLIDHFVERELNLTPYRYIPYTKTKGVEVGISDWVASGVPTTPGVINVAANEGKLVPTFRHSYGNIGSFAAGVADGNMNAASVPTLLCISPGISVGAVNVYGPASIDYVGQLRPSSPDAALKFEDTSPTMTYAHLQNMIAYAQKLGLYGLDRLNGDYVLIGPPAQMLNLLTSLGGYGGTLFGSTAVTPSSFDNYSNVLRLYGEDRRIDLGCGVRLVVDNYATMVEDDWYNYSRQAEGARATADIVPTTFDTVYRVAAPTNGVFHDHVVPAAPAYATDRYFVGSINATAAATVNTCNPWDTDKWSSDLEHISHVSFVSRNNLGPCYLLAEDSVREIMAVPESIKTNEASNYGRLTGLAWHMLGGWKNTCVTMPYGWSSNPLDQQRGGGAARAGGPLSDILTGANSRTALSKCRAIKFDFPMFFRG